MVFRRRTAAVGVRGERATRLIAQLRPIKIATPRHRGVAKNSAPEIRIVTADGEPESRHALRDRLAAQTDFMLVGEARDVTDVITLTTQLNPDILLLDFSFHNAAGIELLERLRKHSTARVILLIADTQRCFNIVELLKAGARGIVSKDSSELHLFKSIRSVFSGDIWLKRHELADAVQALTAVNRSASVESPSHASVESSVRLTIRQREVLALVASGETNKEVARRLAISEDTVKHHITNILDRTGMSSRVELAVFAIERRLIESA
jgi:DNA-binding NarL/FixJ family response regulator